MNAAQIIMTAASNEQAAGDERAVEERVIALAREIAETINAGTVEGRDVLQEMAVGLVRDGVRINEPVPSPGPPASPTGTFNPFGVGILLILMGGVLVFLFPFVGLLMLAAAVVMIVWGVGATLLARRLRFMNDHGESGKGADTRRARGAGGAPPSRTSA